MQSDSFLLKIWCQSVSAVWDQRIHVLQCLLFLRCDFFSEDVLKQFMLLWSLGDILCILNFCDVLFDWNLSAF